ncbi:MAG: GvpL/GvpF family gas vesicle protein [Candidatus Diapherotrites archaeon]
MNTALYLYCAVNERSEKSFGHIGFQEQEVYAVPYKTISVVVQSCSAKELRNKRQTELAINHQYIIDLVMREFNEVIPFNAAIAVKNKKNLNKVLSLKYKKIKSELAEKKDKREYGIQIFYSPLYLKEKAGVLTSVKSFVLQQEQKRNLSMHKEAKYKTFLLNELRELIDEIKVNSAFRASIEDLRDKRILLNLSCLVHKDNAKKLEEKLAEINNKKEFTVKFNGPWAPYSFTEILEE